MSKGRIALMLVVFVLPVMAQTSHPCKVIAQDLSSEHSGLATIAVDTNIYRVPLGSFSNIVVVETEGKLLILSESGKQNPLLFTVGQEAQFTFDHSWLMFPDMRGKKHKFAVVHEEIIQ
jgi:hypothetical protein